MARVYWLALGPASAGRGTPNALTSPAAEAAEDAAAEGAVDAPPAADGAAELSAGAQASRTAGATARPPTTTAERPMNVRRLSFDFSMSFSIGYHSLATGATDSEPSTLTNRGSS